jgi:hypothetical protein
MKISLIKETKLSGLVFHNIYKDGLWIDGVQIDPETEAECIAKAKRMYDTCVANAGVTKSEVIESFEQTI